jgi:anti-sigma factor RsiW
MMTASTRSLQCDYISRLLPWYVNGTLDAEARRQTDRHLKDCENCRQDYVAECQIAEGIQERITAPTRTPHAGWERFAALLDAPAQPESDALAQDELSRSAAALPNQTRRRWFVPLIVGQAAAIALLVIGLLVLAKGGGPVNTFSTLGATDPTVAVPGDLVRLAFASPPTAAEIERLTKTIGVRIVGGPTANNVYTLALDTGRARAGDLAWLRQQPGVVLVEPVARAGAP